MGTTNQAQYIENETGTEVTVESFYGWGRHQGSVSVRYPSGRKYALSWELLQKHFTIVSPQEVFIDAFGAIDDRPTPKQEAIENTPPDLPPAPPPAEEPFEPEYVLPREV